MTLLKNSLPVALLVTLLSISLGECEAEAGVTMAESTFLDTTTEGLHILQAGVHDVTRKVVDSTIDTENFTKIVSVPENATETGDASLNINGSVTESVIVVGNATDLDVRSRDTQGRTTARYKFIPGYLTVPLLLIVGLFGNIASIVVMTRKEFRNMTMSIIIVALALSDTLLIIMQPHNKPYVHQFITTDLRSYNIISCKTFYWFFRTAKMTSSWLIVLISMERLVAVWFPLKAKFINSKRNIITGVCMVYVGIGSFNAAWVSVTDILVGGVCLPNKTLPGMAHVAKIMVVAGTLIYSIIPSCFIMTMNVMIVAKLAIQTRMRADMSGNIEYNSRIQVGLRTDYFISTCSIERVPLITYLTTCFSVTVTLTLIIGSKQTLLNK
jgi:hypothetical protein